MVMMCFDITFHTPNFNGSLSMAIKAENKRSLHAAAMLFNFCK